jgi:hypothetical protein
MEPLVARPEGTPERPLSTWEELARADRLLAAELGVALDEQEVILCDMWDLLALRHRLERALHEAARPSRMGRHPWLRLPARHHTAG